jgi:hypothetical protein
MNIRKMVQMGMLCIAASILMTSCLDDDANDGLQDIPVSYVSLYNASPNAPGLNIIVDNRTINSQPLSYADNTGYMRFYTGERTLAFGPYGANNVTLDTVVTLVDERPYSVFVVDNFERAEVLVLTDTSAAAPATGKAMVRFVNLSPDAAPLALKVKDAEGNLTDEVAFKDATEFMEVDAKAYNLEVTAGSTPVLNLPDISLADGKYYTLLVRGYKTPPSGNSNVLSGEVIRH